MAFADYRCVHCKRLHEALPGLLERHGRLRVVLRHFPLSEVSTHAAVAAECAGQQGRFEAASDALYAQQDQIGSITWESFGKELDVPDMAAFNDCLETADFSDLFARDVEAARSLGARGTPLIVLNGKVIFGMPPTDVLERLIADEVS